ncbi:MAG: hypothetical protein RMI79_02195 [Nitrososphaerota archaeon]|nr:hypothetical protein [Nitrososphaerota archaeon]
MLPAEVSNAFLSTTQLIAVFWFYDKATRKILEKVRNRGFKFHIKGFRIHHWIIGIIITFIGLFLLSIQNFIIILSESGILGLPVKLSSGTVTMGFRVFIDDLKDLKKQFRNLCKR